MKVVCIGSNLESEIALKCLLQEGCDIAALITRPPQNAGNVSDYVDLHPLCEKYGIKTIDTVNVNAAETIEKVAKLKADYLFTLGWSQLFSGEFLGLFSRGVIGSHPTKLPLGRGRAPVPWTVLQELGESAVSFFFMDEGVDSGALLLQKTFKIPPRPYAWDVYQLVAENLGQGFRQIYQQLAMNNRLEELDQDVSRATYTAKRTRTDGLLDFNKTSKEIDLLVRAVSYPYPGAYTFYKDGRVSFNQCRIVEANDYLGEPGQILEIGEEGIRVKTSDSSVWLSAMQLDDGSPVYGDYFKLHARLGYRLEEEIYRLKERLKRLE